MSAAGGAVALGLAAWMGLCLAGAAAHGQEAEPPQAPHTHGDARLDAWLESLRQPGHPSSRCCGPDDAYRVESYAPDPTRPRGFVVTTEPGQHGQGRITVHVPPERVNWDDVKDNFTGRGVIFLGPVEPGEWMTYCFVPGMGV